MRSNGDDLIKSAMQAKDCRFLFIMFMFMVMVMVMVIICTITDQETLGPVVAGEAAAAELEKLQDRFVWLFMAIHHTHLH